MHAQLDLIVQDLEAAEHRLRALRSSLPVHAWTRRPAAEAWSPAECVEHLNLTSEAMLPLLRQALQQARELDRSSPGRYRRDVTGWLIWAALAPSGRVKTKTTAAFVPTSARSADAIVTNFTALQAAVISVVRAADGLPIDRVKLESPFGKSARYNLYAALTLVARHQHRHLGQAERAVRAGAVLASASVPPAVVSPRVDNEPLATR